jgi:hypothetical protein
MLKKYTIATTVTILVMISIANRAACQKPEQLLRDASRYQTIDDTSDRATEMYQQLIKQYPNSAEAESAQYFTGAYYSRKFFIIEKRNNVQDWGSMNRAEQELYAYIGKYPRGLYLADSYNTLAIIALRRDYRDNARAAWTKMRDAATHDRKVYIFRVTWSSSNDDVIKGYCDTASLAATSLGLLDKKMTFDQLMAELTNWARSNCTQPQR